MTEAKLQAIIIRWLRDNDFYVIKCQVPPAPVGCPDVFAVKEGFWIGLEFKSSKTSSKRPLQQETVDMLDDWSYCKFVWPDNWHLIKAELEAML